MLIRCWFSTFVISGDPRYNSHPRSRFGFVTQSSSPGVLGDEIKPDGGGGDFRISGGFYL